VNFIIFALVFITLQKYKKLVKERIILGIDPGTLIMGYSLILQKDKQLSLLRMGVLKLKQYDNQALKLKKIFERVLEIIDEYHPDELAIEAPFFGKNVQSMLKLGRAQGVAMAAALYRDIPIFEYSPRKIKQSITGNGAASKEQVAIMLQKIIKFDHLPDFLDATDATAAAVCHYFQRSLNIVNDTDETKTVKIPKTKKSSSKSSWLTFINNNPDRTI
jgi:crossover junction endodeoxyribonuclease RuvC